MRGATRFLSCTALLALTAGTATAQTTPPPRFSPTVAPHDCAALAGLRAEDTNPLSATQVPTGEGLPAKAASFACAEP